MEHDIELFLSIAEIAGVFVGFGALISFSRDQTAQARVPLRGVVTVGLVVLVASLLPVALARYGLTERTLWAWSSAGFLLIIWVAIVRLFSDPEHRAWVKRDAIAHPALTVLFWVFLEVPIQVPLVLAVLGVAPTLAPAFYVTGLVLNLVEAAFVFARLVFARSVQDDVSDRELPLDTPPSPLVGPRSKEPSGNDVPANVTMRRRTLSGVPPMPWVEAPLEVRRARAEDAGALASVLASALEGETWNAADVEREILCDPTVKAILVVAAGARLVSTASLQVRPESPGSGRVRWVATAPDRRREGLARAVVIGVLELAAQAGCTDAYVDTRTDRLAAIRLYMQLGFEPLVADNRVCAR
jgi:mycothiol synthase